MFECDIYSGTCCELIEKIQDDILNNVRNVCFAVNPLKLTLAAENEDIKKILQGANILIPDGVGVLYAAKKRNLSISERITGIDLMHEICSMAKETGLSIFIYGSTQDNLEKAVENLNRIYPGINIAGYVNGYEKSEEYVNNLIMKSKAKILFVACGSPAQEIYITKNKDSLSNVNFFLGVGGSVDVISGNVSRAPYFIRKANLEWLYRIASQPWRIPHIKKIIKFMFLNHKM